MTVITRKPFLPDDNQAVRRERRSWHRAIAAHALGTLRRDDAAKIAKAAWPGDARAQLIVRGAVDGATRADYPTYDPVSLFRSLAPASAALALFQLGMALDLVGLSTIRIPSLAGLPVQPIFVGENSPGPVVQWGFTPTILGPAKKILMMAAVTGELDDATPQTAEAVIGRILSDVANRGIDTVAFGTAPADATQPAGLLNNAVPLAAAAAGVDAMSDDLGNLVGAIGAAGIDASGAVFVAGPREALIIKAKVGSSKFDYPILETLGLPPKSVACFAPAGIASGYQDPPTIETSKDAVLHMADAPADIVGGSGTLAAPVRSMFQTDVIAIKVRANAAWCALPGAAQVVANVNW